MTRSPDDPITRFFRRIDPVARAVWMKLSLPDRDSHLDSVDRGTAGGKGLVAMGRDGSDGDGDLADRKASDAMKHRDVHFRKLTPEPFRDPVHLGLRHWGVGLIL